MKTGMGVISICARDLWRVVRRNPLKQGLTIAVCILSSLALAPSAYAAPVFFDDFEDGDHSGWLVTDDHVSGPHSTGVEDHNASLMAFAKRTGGNSISLSQDFSYDPNQDLSFTMQAIANSHTTRGGLILNAASGVTISFLNVLNSTLGSVTIANTTDPGFVDPGSSLVDTAQHDYSASVADLATLAGLGVTDPISKMNLSFFASAENFCNVGGCAYSSSDVWFDNVGIVPVPAAVWLFGSGLLGLIGIARRKKAA